MHIYANNLEFHENMHHVLLKPPSISFFSIKGKVECDR